MRYFVDSIIVLAVILTLGVTIIEIGSYANIEETKENACQTWSKAGYTCIGYEGFQWGRWFGGKYGGAKVWHTLHRKENPTVIYTGFVQRWGEEYHLYGPKAVDAISNK